MSHKRELIKNTIIIFLGKACTQFISFLLLPLYTSFLISDEFGIIDLITTYIALLVPLLTLQLESAMFRFLIDAREKEEEQSKVISNIVICCIILSIICSGLFLLINLFLKLKYAYYILFLILTTIFSNLFLQVARGKGDNIEYSLGSAIAGILMITLNVLFITKFNMGAVGMLLAQGIANLTCAVYLFYKEKIYKLLYFKSFDKNKCYEYLKYSIPLVPNGLMWWIINVSDRTIISIFIGVGNNGIYSVSNKFSSIFIGVYNIFNLSWTEQVSLHINDKNKEEYLSSVLNETIKIFSTIALLMIVVIPIFFDSFINKQYAEAYYYIPHLLIGSIFTIFVSMIGSIYVAKKNTKEVAKTSIIAGIINIVLNLLLIKKFRIYAATISTIIAFGIMSIYRYIDVQKYVSLKLNKKNIFNLGIAFIISCLNYYFGNGTTYVITLILLTIFAVIFNYNILKTIYKSITKKLKHTN